MLKICLWNFSDGKHYYMNKAFIQSLKNNNVDYDFHHFGPYNISGVYNNKIELSQNEKKHYLFKFEILKQYCINLPYDYFIFLDADSYCVRPISEMLIQCLYDSPVHSFLESDCTDPNNNRKDWWGCQLPKYVEIMRERGVINEKIYNVNAGFFGVHKKAINQFYHLGMEFWYFAKSKGYTFTEEAPLAYVTHMMTGDPELHKQSEWFDLWASDWIGNYKDRIPDGLEWEFTDYMNGKKHKVNPAIVHAMRSKEALYNIGIKL